ncbi:DUF547 domain-containing protein [Halobacteriovorax marinus]|uniref:DUF547 domain-containing protein n=1 Tax=Halobacteriovorax marinus TaxID=97084 RepID=UPI003A909562
MKLFILLLLSTIQVANAFDHSHVLWQKVLDENLHIKNKQALLDYKNIKEKPLSLNQYLLQLSSLKKEEFDNFTRDQKLALLINAYNAHTVKLIIDHYPVKSIKDIGSLFTSAFKEDFFFFLGHKRNLDWIEHEVIRKKYKEPKIHFALVCASISCPNLQKKAFTANNLEKLFESSAHFFINNATKNDYKDGTLYLSKIFKWYRLDFKGLRAFIKKYSKHKEITDKTPIQWLNYNWELNEWK